MFLIHFPNLSTWYHLSTSLPTPRWSKSQTTRHISSSIACFLFSSCSFYIAFEMTPWISATCLCNSDTWSFDISNTTGVTFVDNDWVWYNNNNNNNNNNQQHQTTNPYGELLVPDTTDTTWQATTIYNNRDLPCRQRSFLTEHMEHRCCHHHHHYHYHHHHHHHHHHF